MFQFPLLFLFPFHRSKNLKLVLGFLQFLKDLLFGNKKKLHIISRFILEGLAPATHRGYINYLTMSREYVRENHLSTRTNDFSGIKHFINDDMPDADKIKEYSDHLDNFESTFSGLKYYDIGRMIMLNTDGLYISFKGTADYLTNTECNNNENQLGLNLSYGTNTCVMDRGNEYFNINPVWDYAYLPGTTSYQLGNIENIGTTDPETNYDKYLSESDKMIVKIKSPEEKYYKDGMYDKHLPAATEKNGFYYGGGYDKEKGVAYLMQRSCHHEENNFTVTCIATKDGMVLLGADLGYTGEITEDGTLFQKNSRKLHTTIEQTFTKLNQTQLSEDNKELTVGNALYRTLDNHNISFTDRHSLVGHWKRNHTEVTADKQVETPNIFIAYIDHDLDREHAKYAYSIQHKNHKDEKFELVHNFDGNKVQEVKLPDGTVAIAAYENVNNYQTSKGTTINLVKGDFKLI